MKRLSLNIAYFWLALFVSLVQFGSYALSETSSSYARLYRSEKQKPLRFETSIVHLASTNYKVALISAVHVGDKSYFEKLNQYFKSYDVLLYELIAPKDHLSSERDNSNPVSLLQLGLKRALALEFQLDSIDYSAPNFVHADLSPDEFTNAMKDKGESFQSLFLKLMFESYLKAISDPQKADALNLKLLMAIMDPKSSLELKRVLAEQLGELESSMTSLNDSAIIATRNDRVLEVLKAQIKSGNKNIAIYYGAGHMPDLERKLIKNFDLSRQKVEWLSAWNLEESSKS